MESKFFKLSLRAVPSSVKAGDCRMLVVGKFKHKARCLINFFGQLCRMDWLDFPPSYLPESSLELASVGEDLYS